MINLRLCKIVYICGAPIRHKLVDFKSTGIGEIEYLGAKSPSPKFPPQVVRHHKTTNYTGETAMFGRCLVAGRSPRPTMRREPTPNLFLADYLCRVASEIEISKFVPHIHAEPGTLPVELAAPTPNTSAWSPVSSIEYSAGMFCLSMMAPLLGLRIEGVISSIITAVILYPRLGIIPALDHVEYNICTCSLPSEYTSPFFRYV